jgi:AcrR family transcriptional regulator
VFRHFPRKEDLVFFRHADFVRRLDEHLAATPDDVPSLDALGAALAQVIGLDDITPDVAAGFVRLLETEPDLRRYEEQLTCDHRDVIAAFLHRRLGGASDAWLTAELLAGAFTGTLAAARRHVHIDTSRTPMEHFSEAVALLRPLPFP